MLGRLNKGGHDATVTDVHRGRVARRRRTGLRPGRRRAGQGESHDAGDPVRIGPELLQDARRPLHGRRRRRRHQLEGPRLRVRAQRRDAAVRVRSERRVREGVRRRQLRLRVRARGARRQGRQRLGRRRGHEHHPEVQPRRKAADGARQAPGSARPARAVAGRRTVLRRQPAVHVPPPDRHRAGIRRATSSSPTATATRAS